MGEWMKFCCCRHFYAFHWSERRWRWWASLQQTKSKKILMQAQSEIIRKIFCIYKRMKVFEFSLERVCAQPLLLSSIVIKIRNITRRHSVYKKDFTFPIFFFSIMILMTRRRHFFSFFALIIKQTKKQSIKNFHPLFRREKSAGYVCCKSIETIIWI